MGRVKKIKYNLFQSLTSDGAAITVPVEVAYTDNALEVAKIEAYNGEYTIEDDGIEERYEPTTEERLEVLESAILEMILEG